VPISKKLILPILLLGALACLPAGGAQGVQSAPQAAQPEHAQVSPPAPSGSALADPHGQIINESQVLEPGASASESPEFRHTVNEIVIRENQLVKTLQKYRPRMEIYIQDMRPDRELGAVPVDDHYFLGRVQFRPNRTIAVRSLLPVSNEGSRLLKGVSGQVTQFVSARYQPSEFYFSLVMDTTRFNREFYNFKFARREYLGNVRCLVFDVTPKPHVYHRLLVFTAWDAGLFEGRIWVEDRNYHIVRFNGTFVPAPPGSAYFHFDSWRENVQPGLWLPAYAYSEESNVKYGFHRTMRFRAQIRFWGYGLENPNHESEMTQIQVDAPNEVKDAAGSEEDLSPVASEREWQEQAQDNVLDRLQEAGLLAPPGDVDKVMETVVNNLIVTNHLDNVPTVHCRILLTSTLESLAIGNTIIMSRGLIDVLPDEPSLAAMLAHELAHIVLQQTVSLDSTKWAFEDRLMIPDEDLLKYLRFTPSERDEEAADSEAIKLLKNSPYKNQLGQAGLFLSAMANMAPRAPSLFGAHLGSRLAKGKHVLRVAGLMNGAPKLETRNVDQIAALPLGARVKVDPWSDAVELMKTKPVALVSAREKMPFEVTPLFPYLTRLPSVQARR
jgi:Peptidase family M48